MRHISATIFRVGRATVFLTGLVVVLAVFSTLALGATSMAFAANGKPFVLGKLNVASAVSTLKKQGPGPALRLVVGAEQPPMTVNSDARVPNLNADKVDGQDADAFLTSDATAGGDLAGTYPNPEIASQAVGTGEINPSQVQQRIDERCPQNQAITSIGPSGEFGDISCEPTGISGRILVTASSPYNNSPGKSATASCGAKRLISGGAEYSRVPDGLNQSFDRIALTGSKPSTVSQAEAWNASAQFMGEGTPATEWRLIAYAICIDRGALSTSLTP